ncbi:MAG: BtpA/SgcQ family protein [Verrucomicrobiales bacterium]
MTSHPDSPSPFRLARGQRVLVGMIHTGPTPGCPGHCPPVSELAAEAARQAELYQSHGFDAVLVENMFDVPYHRREVPPETIAAMAVIVGAVRAATPSLPCGVQVLAGANLAALAVAHACGAHFIRCEGFVFGHLADEGSMQADAAGLLRERSRLGADHISIWADIRKKHSSHAITADLRASDWAMAAEDNLADAVVVTGRHTGHEADPTWLREVRDATYLPVVIGSGLTADNISSYLPHADVFIVGSSLKFDGNWRKAPDPQRLACMREAVEG